MKRLIFKFLTNDRSIGIILRDESSCFGKSCLLIFIEFYGKRR